jgi:hypothetical protein
MRNRALSVLRAQQLTIEQCHVTGDCLDVTTRNFGSTPRKGAAPGNLYKGTGTIGSATFSSSIVSVAARKVLPPGLGDQGSDTQVNICVFNNTFSSSIVSVAARNSRPASALRVLIRRVQHREPRTAPQR